MGSGEWGTPEINPGDWDQDVLFLPARRLETNIPFISRVKYCKHVPGARLGNLLLTLLPTPHSLLPFRSELSTSIKLIGNPNAVVILGVEGASSLA